MNICIIPARGGSKRIPRKNIRDFFGKPIIAYSIEEALKSQLFDRVIVSTDDGEIAELCKGFGAEIPFLRPSAIADDYSDTGSVVRHAITWLRKNEYIPSNVCCIYPTAPFVRSEDLRSGLDVLSSGQVDYVFSAASFSFPIQRAIRINSKDYIEMFDESSFSARSQDLEEAWHDAGQFYWADADIWLQNKEVFNSRSKIVRIPRCRVQDIDSEEDWVTAEALFAALKK